MGNNNVNGKAAKSMTEHFSLGHKAVAVAMSVVMLGFGWPAVSPANSFAENDTALTQTAASEETADSGSASASAEKASSAEAKKAESSAASSAKSDSSAASKTAEGSDSASSSKGSGSASSSSSAQSSEQKATEADVTLDLGNAYITYNNQDIALPSTKVTVPTSKDFKFTATANEGYELTAVKLTVNGVEAELTPNTEEVYTVEAADVLKGASLKLETEQVQNGQTGEEAISIASLEDEIAVSDSARSVTDNRSRGGKTATITPTIENADVAYFAWHEESDTSNIAFTKASGTVTINDYTTWNKPGYVVFFVKPNSNHIITGLGAYGNGDIYAVDATNWGNINGYPGIATVMAAAKSAGYVAAFGWYRGAGSTLDADFTISAKSPDMTVTAVSDRTENVASGDELTFTVTITPKTTGSGKDSVSGVHVNSADVNGTSVQVENLTQNRDGTFTGTVHYTATDADCDRGSVVLTVNATSTYAGAYTISSGDISSSATVTKTATATCKIAPESQVQYQFVSGTDGMSLPGAINGYLPADNVKYGANKTVNAKDPVKTEYADATNGGYWTFTGWDENSKTTGRDGSGVTFTGTWTFTKYSKYTIKYVDEDGNEIADSKTVTGSKVNDKIKVSDVEQPTIAGYSFSKAAPTSELKINSDDSKNVITLTYKKKAGKAGYYLVLGDATWSAPSDTTKEPDAQKWYYNYGFAKGDTFQVASSAPSADNHVFIGWMDKERDDQAAAIRAAGETVTYCYSKNQTYTLDALWASLSATGEDVTYDGKSHTVTVDVNINEGTGLDSKYVEQAKKLITTGDIEYSTDGGVSWSKDKPTFKDSGTYTVKVRQDVTVGGKTTTLTAETQVKIAQREYWVETNTDSKKYDGKELAGTATVKGLIEGESATATATTIGADVTASTTNAVTGQIVWADNTNSSNYKHGTDELGTLEITKRSVKLTSASDEKAYDGTALTNSNVTVEGDGFVNGEGATYEVTGSRTAVGTSDNSFSYALNANTKAENYDITKEVGTLKVTDRKDSEKFEITVEGNSTTVTYDGEEHTASGITTASSTFTNEAGAVFVITADTTSPKSTDVTAADNKVSNVKVTDANNNDVTKQFKVTTKNGKLTINKKDATITAGSDNKEYDGKALTTDEFETSGFVAGQGIASATIEGSQTVVGSTPSMVKANSWTAEEGTNLNNYNISTANGTLTVTDRTAKYQIELEGITGTKTYNGSAQVMYGVKTDTFEFNGETFQVKNYKSDVTGKDADDYTQTITSTNEDGHWTVVDAAGNDVSAQFSVSTTPGKLTIAPKNVTITSGSAEKTYDGTPLTKAEASVTAGGFVEGEEAGVSYAYTGSQTDAGTSKNYFDVVFDGANAKASNYNVTKVEGDLMVNAVTDKVTVTITEHGGSFTYDGDEHTVKGYDVSSSNVLYATSDFTFSGNASVSGTNAGTYEMQLKASDFTNTSENFTNVEFVIVDGTLAINKRAVELTSGSDQKVYDGTALTNESVTVTNGSFVDGQGFTSSATGTITNAGSVGNEFTYQLTGGATEGENGNYIITKKNGKLTVNPVADAITVSITGKTGSGTYNGTEQGVEGYDVSIDGSTLFTKDLVSFSGTASAKGIDADTYYMGLKDEQFSSADTTNFTNVTFKVVSDGAYTINKANVTLKSADLSKPYDGTALTNGETALATETGWVDGQGATYTFTGSQTVVGSSDNAFSYTLKDNTKADNYNITKTEGSLKVTNRDAKYNVTVKANSTTATYDGKEHEANGVETYEFTVNGQKYTVSGLTTQNPKATDAGTYTNNITGTPAVKDANGSDVSSEFSVETENGSLVIEKAAVTLKSASGEWTYDGSAHSKDEMETVSDFAQNEGASYTYGASITNAGEVENSFTYELNANTKADNYTIKTENGTLKVKPVTDEVTIKVKGNQETKTYNGSEQDVAGFSVQGALPSGLAEADVVLANGATASAKGTNVGTYYMNLSADSFDLSEQASKNFENVKFEVEDGKLEITPADEIGNVTWSTQDVQKAYDGTALSAYEASATDAYGNKLTVQYSTDGKKWVNDPSEITLTHFGYAAVQLRATGSNYKEGVYATSSESIAITKRLVTLTSATDSKVFDGTPLTNGTVTATAKGEGVGFIDGEGVTFDVTGSQAAAGTSENTFTYTFNESTDSNDYLITKKTGTLTVTADANEVVVTVKGNSDAVTYDGAAHSVSGYQVSITGGEGRFTADDVALKEGVDLSVSGTDVAVDQNGSVVAYTKALNASDFVSTNANFSNVKFVIDQTAPSVSLTINKRNVTLTSETDEKPYDGTALTRPDVTGWQQTGDTGFVAGEVSDVKATGSITMVGEPVTNAITYTPSDSFKATNYNVVKEEGTLKITPAGISQNEVNWTKNDVVKTYDGQTYSAGAATATDKFGNALTVEYSTDGKNWVSDPAQFTAKNVDDSKTIQLRATNGNYSDHATSTEALTINKRSVTLTSDSWTKAYDGTALERPTVTGWEQSGNTGFVAGEVSDVKATGSVTNYDDAANKVDNNNKITYTEGDAFKASNYTITKNEGTLRITLLSAEKNITVNGNNTSYVYDSYAHPAGTATAAAVDNDGNAITADFHIQYRIKGGTDTEWRSNPAEITWRNAYDSPATVEIRVWANNFDGYAYGEETITITKRPVQLKTKSASKVYDGTPLTTVNDWDGYEILPYQNGGFLFDELATGSDGYPVLGCTGSQTEVGSSNNTITYQLKEGYDRNYEIAEPELGTLTVTAQSIVPDPTNPDSYKGATITDPSDVVYNGTEQKWVPEVKDASGKALVAGSDYTVAYSSDVTNVGTVTVTIQGIGNYTGTSTKTYRITPAPLTVSTPSASKVYDGSALTAAATADSISGLVNNETATVVANGSQTDAGSSENGYTIEWGTAEPANYTVQSENKGTLTVTAKSIAPDPEGKGSMTVNDPSDATYDGQEHKWVPVVKDGDKVLVEGTDYEVSYNNRTDFTNADGTITVTITGKGNYSGSFDRTYQIKKAPLSVVTKSDSKSYDGQALTADGAIDGFVNGESADFKVTGSQTTVGSSANTYAIDWTSATAKQGNYEISEQLGTLTVTESTNEVVVTTTGGTWTYDGQPHGATVAVTNLPAGYTAQATSNAAATDANGEGIAATADNLVILNTEGIDVTNDLKVTKVDGTIKIKPAELSVETFSAKKSYDGTALTAGGKVSGFVGNEAATLVTTGSQTVVGKSDNAYRIEWNDSAKESNYTIASENLGELEVTANATPIYVVPASASKVYDGTALTSSAVTVMGLPSGYAYEASTKGSQTDAGWSYVEVESFKILDASGKDVTSNFSGINAEFKGSLSVTARPVTLTSASASKVYDGTELIAHSATASEPAKDTGMVAGQTFDLEFFGSQTAEGSSGNTFVAKSSSTADVNNYSIAYVNGTLTVGKQAITPGTDPENPDPAYKGIEISNPESVVYDASEHKWSPEVTDKDGNKLIEGTDYEVSYSTADFTNATGAITVTITGKGNYTGAVTKAYEITKRPVTLTSESHAFTYNGQAQGWNQYECTDELFASQVDGLGCAATVTNVGETAENTVGYSFKSGFSENNYNVTKQFGTLSVTAQSITPGADPENPDPAYKGVEVSSPEDKTYNGTEQKWAPEVTDANGDALIEGTDYEVSYSTDNFTDATGTIKVTITGKGNYSGTVERTYQIQPKGYTVVTDSDTKVYDGKALTAGGRIEGIVAGEDAGFAVTGSQTNAGTSTNTYKIEWNGNAKQSNYKLEKETLGTLEVTRAAVTVIAETATKVYGTPDPAYTAKVTGLVNGESESLISYSVTRNNSDENVGTYEKVLIPSGEATQGNYTVTYVPGNFMITRSDELTVVGTNYEGSYDGQSHGSAATASVTEGTTVEYSTDGGATWSQTVPTVKDVADVTVKVRAKNPNYEQAEASYTLKVTPKGYTVTTGTDTKVYDGAALTAGGSIVGIVAGEDAGFQVTGGQTEVGESKNTYEVKWDASAKESNYDLLGETVGTLSVTAQSINPGTDPENPDPAYKGVQVGQLSNVEYNGKSQEQKPAVTDKDGNPLVEGVDYEISFSKDTVNAGEVTVTVTGKGNYAGSVERTYQIMPKGYTVVTDSAEKVYDGVELTAGGKIEGILAGEDAGFQVTGSQTGVGSSGNTYVISWTGSAKKNNYTLTSETVGSLKVTAQSINPGTDPENPDPAYKGVEVGLIPNVEYNGKSQEQKPTVTDKDGNPLTEGVDYKVSISEDTTNAGTVTVKIEGIGNYSGTVERTYQITPKGYSVATETASKVYDGEALTAGGKIIGIVDGEDAGFAVTGSQTEVGESKNTYEIEWSGSAKKANYKLDSESVGTLTVTASDELAVSGTDYVGVYDGSEHGVAAVATVQEGTTVEYSTDGGTTWSDTVPTVKDVSEVTVMVRATNPNYSEATAEYTLKVTPAPLSIVTGSATKVYDGSALTSSDMTITGLVNGETLIARTTGSQTEVGSSANTYALAGGTASLANYEVTESLGTLTVTAAVAPTPDNTPGNNPSNASGNNPVANNVARALADTFTAVTGEEATATPEEQIYDEENPLGAESHSCWVHFYMLIGMVLTALYGLFVAFRRGNHTHQLKKDMNDVMGDGGDDGKDPVATTKPAGTEA